LLAASDDRPDAAPAGAPRRMLLAQAIPFMLLLFLLFPRVQGPLWGMPQDRFTAVRGCPKRCRRDRSPSSRNPMPLPSGWIQGRAFLRNRNSTGADR
jgi:hypothetical protein